MKKISFNTFCIILSLLTGSGVVNAEIYKWVDKKGNAHFTDNPPENRNTEEVEVKINTYSAVEIKPLVERLGRKDKVVMYTASWCSACKVAEKHFKNNKIPYISYDVEKSRTGKLDFKLLRGKNVPVLIVGKKRMNGFIASKFDRLYKEQMNVSD